MSWNIILEFPLILTFPPSVFAEEARPLIPIALLLEVASGIA